MNGSWDQAARGCVPALHALRRWVRAGIAVGVATLALAGCGGGGGGDGGGTVAAPRLTAQPVSTSVNDGSPARFEVAAAGDGLTFQWQRNGADIAAATAAVLSLPAASLADDGARFRVVVANVGGSTTSSEATLQVLAVAPAVVNAPAAAAAQPGETAHFSVTARGSAPIAYQWLRNGVAIAGATAATYTTAAATAADDGALFSVQLSNAAGSSTSAAARLTVTTTAIAAGITTQPQPQTVAAGATATFNVTASGSGPLQYQWRRNGLDIGGATAASYTTAATAASDSGARFSVRVSNAQGAVTSQEAVLTVTAAAAGPYGSLSVRGSGVSSGYRYVPVGMMTSTSLHWYREPQTQLVIALYGGGTGISIVSSPGSLGTYGVNFNCITSCNLAALGISVDLASRTLSFSNTELPIPGIGAVTVDGTLTW